MIKTMYPFFTYYGGKWRAAKHYPKPKYREIVEPFAGAAGYSLRYHKLDVTLYDKDPLICSLWDYLIHVSSSDIRSLPVNVSHIDDVTGPQEARWLIGFWMNKGTVHPCKSPSRWMRDGIRPNSFWGEVIRERIAQQVEEIKHWKIEEKSFEEVADKECTWFIDPPYKQAGTYYKYHDIDYSSLSDWCKNRKGQVLVCEAYGADWLPFQEFRTIKTMEGGHGKKYSKEVLWVK